MPSRMTNYFSRFTRDEMHGWLNKMVSVAVTHMMLMAEVMGYDTAPLEGFEQDKVHEVLRLPMSYWVVEFLAIGRLNGPDKFNSGRFEMGHTVFGEEFGKPLK
jgi:nitroreductase